MKISFIVPVYNVERYIVECVKSITEQTYRNIEIVLVDDGSPDSCPSICDHLAETDNRIRVLHKSNGGLSDARNAGLQLATGDYVIFVDGDDFWLSTSALEDLIRKIDDYPQCHFYGFNCQYYYPETQTYSKWVKYSQDVLTPVSGSSAMIYLVSSGTFPMSACLKVINRQWLVDEQIIFKKGQIAEDIPWFINLLDKCEKCVFINNFIYAYRQNVTGSITHSGGERSFNSLLDIVKTELNLIDQRTFTLEAKDSLRSFLAYEVSILMSAICSLPNDKQEAARKEVKELCWLLKYTSNPKVRIVRGVYSLFGYCITEKMLRIYNRYRSRK